MKRIMWLASATLWLVAPKQAFAQVGPDQSVIEGARSGGAVITGMAISGAPDSATWVSGSACWRIYWSAPDVSVDIEPQGAVALSVLWPGADTATVPPTAGLPLNSAQALLLATDVCHRVFGSGTDIRRGEVTTYTPTTTESDAVFVVRFLPYVSGHPINQCTAIVQIRPQSGLVRACTASVAGTYLPPSAGLISAAQAKSVALNAYLRLGGVASARCFLNTGEVAWTTLPGYVRVRALAYLYEFWECDSDGEPSAVAQVVVDAVSGEVWRGAYAGNSEPQRRIQRGPLGMCAPRIHLLAEIAPVDGAAVLARAILGGRPVKVAHAPAKAVPLTVGQTRRLAFSAITRLLTWRDGSGWHGVRVSEASVAALKPFLATGKAVAKPSGRAAKVEAKR